VMLAWQANLLLELLLLVHLSLLSFLLCLGRWTVAPNPLIAWS
jgi:hypothetical protein